MKESYDEIHRCEFWVIPQAQAILSTLSVMRIIAVSTDIHTTKQVK
jgi:hypothetical protein